MPRPMRNDSALAPPSAPDGGGEKKALAAPLAGEETDRAGRGPAAAWLETVTGTRPLLLIAPHGGRAGAAARATLHPKVNDLHTADITRELARRLGAHALINARMDRNRLDCNRIGQLAARAPWLLELIAGRLEQMAAQAGQVWVLLIHGWNVIEPRLDFGVGARAGPAGLSPAGAACVSASDDFINGPLSLLARRLRANGIIASWGARYPGGGRHNLLQAFTERHRASDIGALARLAALAARGALEAAQLELSVTLRLPGELRERTTDAVADSFSRSATQGKNGRFGGRQAAAVRLTVSRQPAAAPARPPAPAPTRFGMEFYDPSARLGGMASFDLGGGASGARLMLLLGDRRVALFTAEGRPRLEGDRLWLGPLALSAGAFGLHFEFSGPLVVVPDGRAYLSIERALASGTIEEAARVSLSFDFNSGLAPASALAALGRQRGGDSTALTSFGRLEGSINLDGNSYELDGYGRCGRSFTGIGPARFRARRMVWACFPSHPELNAVEARLVSAALGGGHHRTASIFNADGAAACELERLGLEAPTPRDSPRRLSAALRLADGRRRALVGAVECFVPLSRPGPEQSRIYTSLGFARFSLDGHPGSGMFEYSRLSDGGAASSTDSEDESDD